MAAPNAATAAAVESTSVSSDELAAKAVHKRYEGLAVKLRCSLCDAVFSASNPSRTASEHLKRGTCPNFASAPKPISSVPSSYSVSVASVPHTASVSPSSQPPHNQRKRGASSRGAGSSGGGGGGGGSGNSGGTGTTFSAHQIVPPLAIVDPSRFTVDLAYPPAVSIASTSVVYCFY
ncbi:UNVERIFIED_CONTAM: hypothetical protein Sradi_1892700 [Sesamum radiatum]|uniref:DUF7963 domain-containing protein n=1 Tax=Sesamum radiatum TaxID=300843 RepID=A0AAW2TYK2_SESRA